VTTNQLIQQSRAALNLRDKLASCERERDELIALVGISPDEMPSDRGTMIARWLMAWFKASGAQNFVSVDFRDDQTDEWYVIAAHKREGMSPGKMLEHAERERDEARARIATLEAELAASREDAKLAWAEAAMGPTEAAITHELAKLQAHANALRDALLRIQIGCGCGCDDFAAKALAQTPAASLAALKASLVDTSSHDAEVLEPYKAALRVFVDAGALDDFADDFAAEVRALAAQAATHSVPDGTSEVKP
jgi:hypothetical protein